MPRDLGWLPMTTRRSVRRVATDEQDVGSDCLHVWQLVGVVLIWGHGAPTDYECALGCGSVMYRGAGEPFPPTNWSRHRPSVERHRRSST
jgi:hypothetical protein